MPFHVDSLKAVIASSAYGVLVAGRVARQKEMRPSVKSDLAEMISYR